MKTKVPGLFLTLLISLFIVFAGCGKEKSFELGAPARGSLQNSGNGDCLPKTVVGSYVEQQTLTDSNYLIIEVNVAAAGPYTIATDTVNGYTFKGTGVFAAAGLNRIQLKGVGKPTEAGTDLFSVRFDSSSCQVSVVVLPAGSAGPASFTLQGSNGNCMNSSVQGSYAKGVALAGSNSVNVEVNVTATGTYSITTGSVDGMTFSGTGTFATTGIQTVTLTGSGTPENAGTQTFSVSAGSTSCTFTVEVAAASSNPGTSTGDYFPLTADSRWSYVNPGASDSIVVVNTGSVSLAGNSYQRQVSDNYGMGNDTGYFRKSGNDYYKYGEVLILNATGFDQPVFGEYIFLKEGLSAGQQWESPVYSGTVQGVSEKVKFNFTCTNTDTTVTYNGQTFSHVYVLQNRQLFSINNLPFIDGGLVTTVLYAKGVGILYARATLRGTVAEEQVIKNYNIK